MNVIFQISWKGETVSFSKQQKMLACEPLPVIFATKFQICNAYIDSHLIIKMSLDLFVVFFFSLYIEYFD